MINTHLQGVTSQRQSVVVDKLMIVLAAIDRDVRGRPDDRSAKCCTAKSVGIANCRNCVIVGDILKRRAISKTVTELTNLDIREDVCPRRADIVLSIVIRSEIVAQDRSARFANLATVLIAQPERVTTRWL